MGVVNTTYTFTNTDTITSAKMNNIIDDTTFTSNAIQGTTLQVVSPGKLAVNAGGITSNELAFGAVSTNALADGAVTPAKLSTAGPSWDGAGGTFLLSQRVLEVGSGITSNADSIIDFHAVHPLTDYEARIIRTGGANGWLVIQNQGGGRIQFLSAEGVQFASAPMPNPVGTAPLYSVRAFAKVATNGTVANNKGFSSISKTGTGIYTLILDVTPAEDPIVVATCHTPDGSSFNYSAAVQINAANNFTVKTGFEDTSSLRDMSFSIMVIY
jgi:hypothetical protein